MPPTSKKPGNETPDVYINARIDAAAVNAMNGSREPFWNQAYTNAIHRIRMAVMQTGAPEPSLRDTAALLENDIRLEGIFTTATAKTEGTPDEADGRSSRNWLQHDWLGLDHNLRNAIRKGIRNAANSKLSIQHLGRSGPPTPIGDRDENWIQERELLWDTATLPEDVQKAIRETIRELCPEIRMSSTPSNGLQRTKTRCRIIDTVENAVTTAATLGISTHEEHEQLTKMIRRWREANTPTAPK